ncbi:MAG: hypothetical protein AAGB16_01665 [Pseudomonadota bacterium]
MLSKRPNWKFHAQVLSRAIDELEAACSAHPGSEDFFVYRREAPEAAREAREALADLKRYIQEADEPHPSLPVLMRRT